MPRKIISFPKGHFNKTKPQAPLSFAMIVTLVAACSKQSRGIPFGPKDMKGSFTSLIKRGLIVKKDITLNEETASTWQVTEEAITMLRALKIDVAC